MGKFKDWFMGIERSDGLSEERASNDGDSGKQSPWSRLPNWAWALGGVLAVLVAATIGYAAGSSELDDLESEVVQATQERDEAEAAASAVTDRRGEIVSAARKNAAQIVGKARSERSELGGKLEELRRDVRATEGELADVESSLGNAQREKRLSSFGNGTWQADVDFIPGTYRTAGNSGCYWAKLNSTDTFDIADNENGEGPQVVTLDTPYFQSKGCGTWERVNE